jgi:hypothetical protein
MARFLPGYDQFMSTRPPKDIQTIEIHGERFVILPEREFLAMRPQTNGVHAPAVTVAGNGTPRFREVTPLPVDGAPASELLLRDRR